MTSTESLTLTNAGTSVYFWAFPSKATQARKRKLDMVTEDRDKVAVIHMK